MRTDRPRPVPIVRQRMHKHTSDRPLHGKQRRCLRRMAKIRSKETVVTKKSPHDKILLAHGGGGQLSDQLIQGTILSRLSNDTLDQLGDSANLNLPSGSICINQVQLHHTTEVVPELGACTSTLRRYHSDNIGRMRRTFAAHLYQLTSPCNL